MTEFGTTGYASHYTLQHDGASGLAVNDLRITEKYDTQRRVVKIKDVSGIFTPNTYKTTPYLASTLLASPDFSDLTAKWRVYNNRTYTHRVWGALSWVNLTHIPACYNGGIYKIDDAIDQVLLVAASKVGASDLDLGVELGEVKETIAMLKSPLKDLRKLLSKEVLRALPHIMKYEGAQKFVKRRALRSMPSTWLEIRYGIMPLIRSIHDILKVLEEKLSKLDTGRIYTARSHLDTTSSYSQADIISMLPVSRLLQVNIESKHKLRAFVHYRFEKPPTSLEALGLSLGFLPEISWDLLSLSFMFGWFVNIKQVLGAHRFDPDVTILGNCVGISSTGCGTSKIQRIPTTNTYLGEKNTSNYEYRSYERLVNVELSWLPSIRANIDLSIPQMIDIVLIAKQILQSRR